MLKFMPDSRPDSAALLARDEPHPAETVNAGGASPVVLVCEHAGRMVPARLDGLGLDAAAMDKHIAWDIGAAALARDLSARLDAPLVLQRYSRLVIDANRPLSSPGCIPEISDGVTVPGNRALDDAARRARYDAIHAPFHGVVADLLDRRAAAGQTSVLVTIHSFTPELAGVKRPMAVGLLFNRDDRLAIALRNALTQTAPGEIVALNAPYNVDDDNDFAIPVHGEARGLAHVLVEVRNDRIADPDGQTLWAARLAGAITLSLETLELAP